MTMSETDKILNKMVQEHRGIRRELHDINRNIQFLATLVSDLPNQSKVEMLKTIHDSIKQEADSHE